MFYRFKCGAFVKADSFEEAKAIFIQKIMDEEEEDNTQWTRCTCTGLSHRPTCPEMAGVETF